MNLEALLALDERICFRADALDAGLRLDVVLHKRVSAWAARGRVTRWVREGRATVDGVVRRAARPCHRGEEIRLVAPKNTQDLDAEAVDPDSIPLIDRGEGWLVVDKPPGLRAHPARGQIKRTLAVALAQRFGHESEAGGPWLCHRLDRDTSGLVLVALTRTTLTRFMMDFEARRIRRFYAARVMGAVPWSVSTGGRAAAWDDNTPFVTLDTPLRLENTPPYRVVQDAAGQACVTRVQVAAVSATRSDLFIEPVTGRQHQIRVHLAGAGHGIVGDRLYGTAGDGTAEDDTAEDDTAGDDTAGDGTAGDGTAGRMMLHAMALWIPGERAIVGAVPWALAARNGP